jgi:hypothetical protein
MTTTPLDRWDRPIATIADRAMALAAGVDDATKAAHTPHSPGSSSGRAWARRWASQSSPPSSCARCGITGLAPAELFGDLTELAKDEGGLGDNSVGTER